MKGLKQSAGIRMMIIAALTLFLLIPALMVTGIIKERERRRDGTIREISSKWGNAQTIAGPILTLPFKRYHKNEKGKVYSTTHYAHFLPDGLKIEGHVNPEIRYRGIYEVILYNSTIHISGSFSSPDLRGLNIPADNVVWRDAFISVGISDMKGIKETIKIAWNGSVIDTDPGVRANENLSSGISTRVGIDDKTRTFTFGTDMNINGSEELYFVPFGKETTARISANWDTPSFTGAFLPASRDIKEDSFSADWKVLHLNRNYPQQWTGQTRGILSSAFGVKFLMPIDEYQKTMRTAKYAVMFIVLTFLSFFMIEIMNKKAIHPVQYIMIGLALILFYTLLLSLSEHMLFRFSYAIAASFIVAIISGYAKSVLSSTRLSFVIAALLAALYVFMYVILQLQDYALLLGSTGLLVILASVMYLTRKMDWFTILTAGTD